MIIAACSKCHRNIDSQDYDPKINIVNSDIVCNVCLGVASKSPESNYPTAKQMFDVCYLAMTLDRSGSMNSCKEGTITGFNTFLRSQKDVPGEAYFYMLQFDDQFDVVYDWENITTTKELTAETFIPRGSTALLDAIGRTIIAVAKKIQEAPKSQTYKVIVSILTDGYENFSHEYNRDLIFKLISDKRKEGWEFLFLGANQDAIAEATKLGISAFSSMTFTSSNKGIMRAYGAVGQSLGSYRTTGSSKSLRDWGNDQNNDQVDTTKKDDETEDKIS